MFSHQEKDVFVYFKKINFWLYYLVYGFTDSHSPSKDFSSNLSGSQQPIRRAQDVKRDSTHSLGISPSPCAKAFRGQIQRPWLIGTDVVDVDI